jgi:hypothetical protein
VCVGRGAFFEKVLFEYHLFNIQFDNGIEGDMMGWNDGF